MRGTINLYRFTGVPFWRNRQQQNTGFESTTRSVLQQPSRTTSFFLIASSTAVTWLSLRIVRIADASCAVEEKAKSIPTLTTSTNSGRPFQSHSRTCMGREVPGKVGRSSASTVHAACRSALASTASSNPSSNSWKKSIPERASIASIVRT